MDFQVMEAIRELTELIGRDTLVVSNGFDVLVDGAQVLVVKGFGVLGLL